MYVRLKLRNDWGTQYYTLPNKGLSEHGTVSYRRGRIDIPKDTKINCLYKCPISGKETRITCTVKHKTVYDNVSDMGSSYSVATHNFPYFDYTKGQKKATFRLDEVKVDKNQVKEFEVNE